MAAAALPPLPADLASGDAAGNVPAGARNPSPVSSAAMAGGLPAPIKAMMQIEEGIQTLVTSIPSIAPIGAAIVSQLRQIVPQAMQQAVQQGPGAGSSGPGNMPQPPSPPPQPGG